MGTPKSWATCLCTSEIEEQRIWSQDYLWWPEVVGPCIYDTESQVESCTIHFCLVDIHWHDQFHCQIIHQLKSHWLFEWKVLCMTIEVLLVESLDFVWSGDKDDKRMGIVVWMNCQSHYLIYSYHHQYHILVHSYDIELTCVLLPVHTVQMQFLQWNQLDYETLDIQDQHVTVYWVIQLMILDRCIDLTLTGHKHDWTYKTLLMMADVLLLWLPSVLSVGSILATP